MFSASEFFGSRDLGSRIAGGTVDVDSFWQLIAEEQSSAAGERTRLREATAPDVFFRGQSDEQYGLSASLHRAIKSNVAKEIFESQLLAAEEAIRERAKSGIGVGKGLSELEFQMLLQHHHAPTRLLDVSRTPMEALYFATEDKDLTDGRLFVVHVDSDHGERFPVDLANPDGLPWAKYSRGARTADALWTQSVTIVEGRQLDPRMIAQNGVFLVGGIQRSYSNLNIQAEGGALDATQLQQLSMLTIAFPKGKRSSMGKNWPAYAWTFRIPSAWKAELRRRLRTEYEISHETIYPAFESLKWEAESAVRGLPTVR